MVISIMVPNFSALGSGGVPHNNNNNLFPIQYNTADIVYLLVTWSFV